jgi:hypothetical protein
MDRTASPGTDASGRGAQPQPQPQPQPAKLQEQEGEGEALALSHPHSGQQLTSQPTIPPDRCTPSEHAQQLLPGRPETGVARTPQPGGHARVGEPRFAAGCDVAETEVATPYSGRKQNPSLAPMPADGQALRFTPQAAAGMAGARLRNPSSLGNGRAQSVVPLRVARGFQEADDVHLETCAVTSSFLPSQTCLSQVD